MVGKVKWFNSERGYGFITGEDGEDIFVHYTGIVGVGYRNLEEGQTVRYRAEPRGDRERAVNVEVID